MIPSATQGESVVESSVQQMIRKNDFLKRAVGGLNVAVNPKMSLLYQGPGKFRQFTFEFPMIAKSEGESETIRQIIKLFRSATLPGYTENHLPNGGSQSASGGSRKRGAGSNFFSFPNKFKIKFGHAGTTGGSSFKGGGAGTPFKIATSVCKSAVVNYAAAGVPFFFENGATSYLNISYDQLAPFGKYKEAKPTIHKYNMRNVASKFLHIDSNEWNTALHLPVEDFRKATKAQVWLDSREKIKAL